MAPPAMLTTFGPRQDVESADSRGFTNPLAIDHSASETFSVLISGKISETFSVLISGKINCLQCSYLSIAPATRFCGLF